MGKKESGTGARPHKQRRCRGIDHQSDRRRCPTLEESPRSERARSEHSNQGSGQEHERKQRRWSRNTHQQRSGPRGSEFSDFERLSREQVCCHGFDGNFEAGTEFYRQQN